MSVGEVGGDLALLTGLGITIIAVAASGATAIIAALSPIPANLAPLLGVLFLLIAIVVAGVALLISAN